MNSKVEKKEGKIIDNKERAISEINCKYFPNIKAISKELRKDKDIIKAYWEKVYKDPTCFMGCSIIAIDDFGNSIIEDFKKIEFKRHVQSRLDEYEENTEEVQFIKCKNKTLEKEIFEPILDPLIILIGNKRNSIANKIIEKYYNNNDMSINIIEVYKNDITTKNIKFISKSRDEIIYFLRIITYTTAEDTWLTEDNLSDIRLFFKKNLENKNLEIRMVKDISDIQLLESDFLNGKIYICQIVSNNAKSFNEYWSVVEQIEKRFKTKNVVEYHLHNSCNIAGFEAYLLKID